MRKKVSIPTGELLTGVIKDHWTTSYLLELLNFDSSARMFACLKGSMNSNNFTKLKKGLNNNDKMSKKNVTSTKTCVVNFETEIKSEDEIELLRKKQDNLMDQLATVEDEISTLTANIATVDESLVAIDSKLDGYFKTIAMLKSKAVKLVSEKKELTDKHATKMSDGENIESEILEIDNLIRKLTVINISVDVKNLTYQSDKKCANAEITMEEIMEKINSYPILRTLTFNTIEFLLQLKKIEREASPFKVVFDFGEELAISQIFNSIS